MKKKGVGYYTQEVDTSGGDSNSMAIRDYDNVSNKSMTIYSMPYE
jgi:hypothetical protein